MAKRKNKPQNLKLNDTPKDIDSSLVNSVRRAIELIRPIMQQRAIEVRWTAGAGASVSLTPENVGIADYAQTEARLKKQLLNMSLNAELALMAVLSVAPQVTVKSRSISNKPFQKLYAKQINRIFVDADCDSEFDAVIRNSLYGVGMAWTDKTSHIQSESDFTVRNGSGEININNVPGENIVWDINAVSEKQMRFYGHFFDIQRSEAKKIFPKKADYLQSLPSKNQQQRENQILKKAMQGQGISTDNYLDEIELLQLWCPFERKIVILPGNIKTIGNDSADIIDQFEYKGPASGPYKLLMPLRINDSMRPISIMGQMMELAWQNNLLFRKTIRRILREKENIVGHFGEKAQNALQDARDGQVISVEDGKDAQAIKQGGISTSLATGQNLFIDLFNRASLRSDVIGGQSAGSKTLGQDELLLSQSTAVLKKIQEQVIYFVRDVANKVAWHVWNTDDPREMTVYEADGITINETWNYREGVFDDYNLDIDVFVGKTDTPEANYQRKMQLVKDIALPFAPIMLQTGKIPDVEYILDDFANDLGLEDYSFFGSDMMPQNQSRALPDINAQTNITNQGTGRPAPVDKAVNVPQMQLTE